MKGVKKGAFSLEEAQAKHEAFVSAKDAKVEARRQKVLEEKRAYWAQLSGSAPSKKAANESKADASEAAAEE
jgi:hypothetical protein